MAGKMNCEICLDGLDPGLSLPRVQWLRCYVQVIQTGSFSGAAADLGVTEGAVRQSVNALEQHLGMRLFDRRRTREGVTPTSVGRLVLPTAHRILYLLGSIAGR